MGQVDLPILESKDRSPLPAGGPRIVAFAGKAGAGKDTAAMALRMRGYALVRFADPLKEALAGILGVSPWELEDREFKEAAVPDLGVTPRYMAQTLGTEWGRRMVHEDIWVQALARRALPLLEECAGLVIPDCRFPNEAQWVLDLGGVVFRVEREDAAEAPAFHRDTVDGRFRNPGDSHVSEAPLPDAFVTDTLLNDGDILALYDRVHEALAVAALKRLGLDG